MKIDSAQILAFDPLQSKSVHANLTQEESLHKAAEQFEAIFLQLVLKNMHAATDTLAGENGFFSGKEQQLFRDMHDAQLAQSLAGSSQLGLAETMVRQLSDSLGQTENKFKQMAELAALTDTGTEILPVTDYQNTGFAQPLLVPHRTEDYKQ
ncbi:rod-binding protein [Chromatiaceae bacterium AAb-1]|nr:rod-binding protein [Chromatiaceae bacterium AAb-1]